MIIDNNFKFKCILIFVIALFGCNKENTNSMTTNSSWDLCQNNVAKELHFRIGAWVQQTPKINPSMDQIVFINDSIIEIFDNKGNHVIDNKRKPVIEIKYDFKASYFNSQNKLVDSFACNIFRIDQYWITDRLSNVEYMYPYKTSYNSLTKEWYLIERERNPSTGVEPGWDTIRFKKK